MMLKLTICSAMLAVSVAGAAAFAAPSPPPARGLATTIMTPQSPVKQVYYYRGGYYRYRWNGGYYNHRRWYHGRWRYW
jgi:hypothetical protein